MVAVNFDQEKLAEICRRWKVSQLSVFGSAVRGDFREDSDVDLLVSFHEGESVGLFGYVGLRDELADFFGRRVDLVSREGLLEGPDCRRTREILKTAEPVYAP